MKKQIGLTTLDEFYNEASAFTGKSIKELLPPDIHKAIGHFNVFDVAKTIEEQKRKSTMPYNRRAYYKISLIRGKNKAEYADKVIEVKQNALLFASPKIPYHWTPLDANQSGTFCVFTSSFLSENNIAAEQLPIFQPGGYPVFEINNEEAAEIEAIFAKIKKEINTSYPYKYDLLRNYVMELIHFGQKLQPASIASSNNNASERILALFIELLERQFSKEPALNSPILRSPKEFAERLAIHVNHLNKALKESTGHTTSEIISQRIIKEAKILLKQTEASVSEISNILDFDEVSHFSHFFKKHTGVAPLTFRTDS